MISYKEDTRAVSFRIKTPIKMKLYDIAEKNYMSISMLMRKITTEWVQEQIDKENEKELTEN